MGLGTGRLIQLQEYQTSHAMPLSAAQLDLLRRARVGAMPVGAGRYDLRPESIVGVVDVDGDRFVIAPKVGIGRLLFLLAYGMGRRKWQDLAGSFAEDAQLVDAMATLFAEVLDAALARGVQRDYVRRQASGVSVRGRIDLARQLRRHHGRMPPVEIAFDDYTVDTPVNRLLLTAALRLRTLHIRTPAARRMLGLAVARLEGVRPEDYAAAPVPDMPVGRTDADLQLAVTLARLIVTSRSLEISAGSTAGAALLFDLNDVFEDFVVAALGEQLGLGSRAWPQNCSGHPLYLDRDRRVKLEPDLSWWKHGTCAFVGDVKYKSTSSKGVTHPDLYQLLSYASATGLADGLLIYADGVEDTLVHNVPGGRRLHVARLDVSGHLLHVQEEVARVSGLVRHLAGGARSLAS